MKKFLLILIVLCAFLIIFYGSTKSPMVRLVLFQTSTDKLENTAAHHAELDGSTLNNSAELKLPARSLPLHLFQRSKRLGLSTNNEQNNLIQTFEVSDYNIFVIYTKGNYQIQKKFQLFVHSLIKYASVELYLHIITDTKSQTSAEGILLEQIRFFRKKLIYRMYDIRDAVAEIADIAHVMKPYFNSNPGSYYSDVLFFVSLGMHRIADTQIERAILVDCDVVFRTDVRLLFKEFKHFSNDNLFGLAPELTPVYRHILYRYRSMYPKTEFGNPYYPAAKAIDETYPSGRETHKTIRSSVTHGYPGLNSGVVLLDLKRIRNSQIYLENLKEEQVRHLSNKYYFKGHLGDQDFYTLLGYEFPSLIYRLDCVWNRQLCTWWKEHGYSDVFDTYFYCEGEINLYHGNCNTRIPE